MKNSNKCIPFDKGICENKIAKMMEFKYLRKTVVKTIIHKLCTALQYPRFNRNREWIESKIYITHTYVDTIDCNIVLKCLQSGTVNPMFMIRVVNFWTLSSP